MNWSNAFVGQCGLGSVVLSFLALADTERCRVEVSGGNVDEIPEGIDGGAAAPNGRSGVLLGVAVVIIASSLEKLPRNVQHCSTGNPSSSEDVPMKKLLYILYISLLLEPYKLRS